jgi:hypothetical protein
MNPANLQLEGLYLAIASITNLLVTKGEVSREELDVHLGSAEEAALRDTHGERGHLSPAQRDAVAFPFRLLRLANNSADADGTVPFSELARMVGQTKSQGSAR